jgi:hypothetical protein
MVMNENDRLNSLLREWEAPEPAPALDARVRASYRQAVRPSMWQRLWSARVSIPAPVFAAALLLIAAGIWLQTRSGPPAPAVPAPQGYVTRLDSAGFQPLPDGAVRVIRSGEVKQ